MQNVKEVFRDIQIGLGVAQSHRFPEPLDSTGVLLFIPVHNADVVRRARFAATICALVPIHGRSRVSSNALARVIEIAKIDLARRISSFCGGEKKPKRRSEVAFVRLFGGANE